MRPQVGETISGKYRLVRLIGEGGMGSVYEARHEYLGSAFALKFLDAELAKRSALVARFLQEARVSASVRSPHVVQVSDVDQSANGVPYLVMELLEGESLQRMLARSGRLPVSSSLDVAVQILNGLEAAHNARVVHRDLKPDNIFVVPTRQGPLIKILDFGIAKLRVSEEFQRGLTRPGVLMGTPEYMAPEQAFSADTADHRADLFSVGVILFEMLTGRRPILGDDPRAMAAGVLAGNIPTISDIDPSLPAGLAAIIRKSMSGRPADRFANAVDMRTALSAYFAPTPNSGISSAISAPPQTVGHDPSQGTPRAPTGSIPTAPGAEPMRGVAPTLPPAAPQDQPGAPVGKTGTVVGSSLNLAGDYGATAPISPYGYGPAPNMQNPMNYGPPVAVAPARPKRQKGLSLGIIAVIAGAAAGVIAIAVIVAMNRNGGGDEPQVDTVTPPVTTPSEVPLTPPEETVEVPSVIPPPTVATTPTQTQTYGQPPRRDAGADSGATDAGANQFPFPLPSSFPSAIPIPFPSFPVPIPRIRRK